MDTKSRMIDAVDVRSRESRERLFVSCLPLIKRVVAVIGQRYRLSPDELEELTAIAQLHIIKDDYAVLRKFQGRCRIRTFLAVVIQRVFLDYRTSRWGRWRPSTRSRKIGEIAILLEQLTVRDGFTFDEACMVLETNHRFALDRNLLERYTAGFPRRARPRLVGEDALEDIEASHAAPDDGLVGAERMKIAMKAAAELAAALERFAPQDRLILKLRFDDGVSTAEIARMLHVEPQVLYGRVARLLLTLRTLLEARGLRRDEVLAALGASDGDSVDVFRADDGDEDRTDDGSPSPRICNVA